MRGVKKVVPVGDTGVAVVADNFWNAKTALAAMPIVWDEGPNAKVTSATIADMLKEGLDAEQAFVGNKAGDAKAAHRRCGESGGGGLQLPLPEPLADGADEHHRALYAGKMRGLVSDAERRGDTCRDCRGLGPAGREMRRLQAAARRRVRPARRLHRLCAPGGADRDADAGDAGQAAVDARRGHDARLLSPDNAMQTARRA